MSRWFPDTLRLRLGGVEPEGANAALLAAEPDRSVDRAAAMRAARLERQLATCAAQLDGLAPAAGTRLRFWLGGDTVRHLIVPWQDSLTRPSQRTLLAQHCFREVFGASAAGWAVRMSPAAYGRPALASAVDGRMLERLEALARERRLKLVSVQPLLVEAYNRALVELRKSRDAWFVLLEPPWMTLLLMRDGSPDAVKLLQASDAELGRVLEREWRALGIDTPRCQVVLARFGDALPVATATLAHELSDFGWKLLVLDPLVDDTPAPARGAALASPVVVAPPVDRVKVAA